MNMPAGGKGRDVKHTYCDFQDFNDGAAGRFPPLVKYLVVCLRSLFVQRGAFLACVHHVRYDVTVAQVFSD